MPTERDYLRDLAAKTVECPVTLKSENRDGSASQHGDLCDCKGTERVLDPRFDKLRSYDDLDTVDLARGYTVVSDLAVLLSIADTVGRGAGLLGHICGKLIGETCGPPNQSPLSPETIRAVAAEVFWDWLEAQEEV